MFKHVCILSAKKPQKGTLSFQNSLASYLHSEVKNCKLSVKSHLVLQDQDDHSP